MSVAELNKQIDYTKTKIEDRKNVVEGILSSGFYENYFDEKFKVNITNSENLSESNNVCNSLERLANYLLNSDEVKEEKKDDSFEYKFYSDEEAFRKAIVKEPKIDGMASGIDKENVIHFLKKENRNFKKSKDQRITKKDLQRDDELGRILRDYTDYLEKISKELNNFEESNLSRFKLSEISGQLKNDMILSKDILLGVFGYKTNHEESSVLDWDMVDFTNFEHVKALLYMKPGRRADEELMYVIEDFNELYYKAKPTKLQREIVELMREENMKITDIGNELNIPKQNVNKNIKHLAIRICRVAAKQS